MLLFFVTCLLLIALIVSLIRWISRLSRLGGVAEAVDLVAVATRRSMRDLAHDPFLGGAPALEPPLGGWPVEAPAPGFVQAIDAEALGCLARDLDTDLHLLARPGAFVGPGRPLLLASAPVSEEDAGRVRAKFLVGGHRTYEKDPRFGLTVLSEIASRALSPGVNDPGTAIDVVTTSMRLLSDWAREAAEAKPEVRHPRLHVQPLPAAELMEDAFQWIARDGAGQLEVQLWVQKTLAMLAAQDEDIFGAGARRLSDEAFERALAGLGLPGDREALRLALLAPKPL